MAIRKRGKGGIWWVDFTDPSGQRVRQSSGSSDKKAAQELHDRLKNEAWRTVKLGENPRRLFDEGASRWLQEKSGKASLRDDVTKIQFFRQHFGGRTLDSITREEVDALLSPMSPATANRHMAWLRAMLRMAEFEWKWIEKAPKLRSYKERKRRVRWLTLDEVKRLVAVLPENHRDPAWFALLTGLRQANVYGLEWSQVNLETALAWIHPDQAKARRAIAVPLCEEAVKLIARQPRSERFVFAVRNRPTDKVWKRALEEAGIEDFRWHDLRHTWASWHV
jgi:integrase